MGFQMTVLLSLIVYVDILTDQLPVFDQISNSPKLLQFFIVNISGVTLSLIVSIYTLKYYFPKEHTPLRVYQVFIL